jgi:hypothetical protein
VVWNSVSTSIYFVDLQGVGLSLHFRNRFWQVTPIGKKWHLKSLFVPFRASPCSTTEVDFDQAGVQKSRFAEETVKLSKSAVSGFRDQPVQPLWHPSNYFAGKVLRGRRNGGIAIYTRRLPDGQIIMAIAAAGAAGGTLVVASLRAWRCRAFRMTSGCRGRQ